MTPLAWLVAVEAPLLPACLVLWAEIAARDYRTGRVRDRARLTDGWETPCTDGFGWELLPRRRLLP
jgi:hypothetical protein